MGKWSLLYTELTGKHDYIKPNESATMQQIAEIEKSLGCALPTDIKELLSEVNGDGWFLFSVEQIIETNLTCRNMDCFMPLDCLLFFAGNGSGDYYGYPITRQDGVRDDCVFIWDHEYDNRKWVADSLEDVIRRYYAEEC